MNHNALPLLSIGLMLLFSATLSGQNLLFEPPYLESKYPMRMAIDSASEAFKIGKDSPAQFIDVPERDLIAAYNKTTPTNLSIDLEEIFDLNREASRIWQAILICVKDPEKARRAYFDQSFPCKNGTNLITRLITYHQSILAYIDSTDIPALQASALQEAFEPPLGTSESDLQFVRRATGVNGGAFTFPDLHPLFIQILWEFTITNYTFIDPDGPPDPKEYQILGILANTSDRTPALVGEIDTRSDTYYKTKRSMTIALIMELFPVMPCSRWGLWPGSIRPILNSMNNQEWNQANYGRTKLKVIQACGQLNYHTTAYAYYINASGRRTNSGHPWRSFIRTYRELAAAYLEEKTSFWPW